MEDELANLHLAGEEEDAFQEDPKETDHHLQFCLVGTCLTNSVVHFPSLQNTMADLWHPIGGIAIINLGPHSKQGFAAINGGISPVFNVGIKTGFGPNNIGDNVNELMDLGSNGESSLILTDERKKCQRTLNIVTLRSFSHNHIDVEIQDEQDGSLLRFIGFYGNPDEWLKGIFSVGWVTIKVSIG
ncbi:hypothetical protein Golob_000670 [Gossypium lobatum]|uniref:DUF4283 domain-containing protein n=1 Tax=Gossypium lobatum TaxID=34289 RepID=A0A7J8N958_9ROSI|nr:hypothetical protein [Gossypium lobatum]